MGINKFELKSGSRKERKSSVLVNDTSVRVTYANIQTVIYFKALYENKISNLFS
jgi:hypothetical protein